MPEITGCHTDSEKISSMHQTHLPRVCVPQCKALESPVRTSSNTRYNNMQPNVGESGSLQSSDRRKS